MATGRNHRRRPDHAELPVALRAAALLITAGLLLAMWVAITLGRAASLGDGVLEDQVEWQGRQAKSGDLPSLREWEESFAELAQARKLDPRNPQLAEQLGQLYLAGVKNGSEVTAFGSRAIEPFVEAVAMRPSSPYAWANLAWAKYYSGQVDKVFYAALANAARLGPWEKEIQLIVVDLGLALWNDLPADLRAEISVVAGNAQLRMATEVVAIGQKRGRLGEVCGLEKTRLTDTCKSFVRDANG